MTGRRADLVERDSRIAQLAAEGLHADAIADRLCIPRYMVNKWIRQTGTKLVRKSHTKDAERIQRDQKMAAMYRHGVTLEKIGKQFKLTRERVRQILGKNGVQPGDGGGSLVAKARRAASEQARETRYLGKYGLPVEVVKQLQKDRVTHAFNQQRQSAKNRGIVWNLTFAQWFAVWQSSGKLHLRGIGKGKYVMSRVSDAGCYEMGNIHIQLGTENSREAVEKWRGKTKANRGVFCLYPGRELAWLAKVSGVSLGFYRTEQEAVEARNNYIAAHPDERFARPVRGYTHIKATERRSEYFQVTVGRAYVGSYKTAEAAVAARADYLEKQAA